MPGIQQALGTIFTASGGSGGTVTYDAVSLNTGSTLNGNGVATTLTYGMTVTGGLTNPYLVVSIGIGHGATAVTVSGVTFDGVAMTQIGTILVGASGHGRQYLYGLAAPHSGSVLNVVVTVSPAPASGEVVVSGATSFSRVNQASPYSNVTTASGNSTTASASVSSSATSMVVGGTNGGSNYSAWQAVDTWHNNASTGTGGGCVAFSRVAGSGTVTPTWTLGSDSWAVVACSLNGD